MIKLLVALILAVAALTSCGAREERPPIDPWANVGTAEREFTVNPVLSLNIFAEENILSNYLVGRLMETCPNCPTGEMRFIPALAEGFAVSEDGLTWTFRIRENLFFSDGTPIDAFTFEHSARAWLDPIRAYPSAERFFSAVRVAGAREYATGIGTWANVGVFAPNRLTLQIILEAAIPTALGLYYLNIPAVHRDFYEQGDFDINRALDFPTSGPYRIARHIACEGLVLESDILHPNAIRHHAELMIVRLDEGYRHTQSGGNPWFIYINAENSPLNDINLRKALHYGLDRERLIRTVSAHIETQSPLTPFSRFVPRGSFVGDPADVLVLYENLPTLLPVQGFNPGLAQEYFRQAFYNNGSQTIRLTITAFQEPLDWWGVLAIAVRDQWAALFGCVDYFHLLLDLRPPQEVHNALAQGEFELAFGAFTHSPLDVWATMAVWTSYYPTKPDSFRNQAFDELQFNAAFGELMRDYEGKIEALIEMERLLFDFMPAIPIFMD